MNYEKLQVYRQDQCDTHKEIISQQGLQYNMLNQLVIPTDHKMYRENHK